MIPIESHLGTAYGGDHAFLLVFVVLPFSRAEEEGNAPKTGECYCGVNNSCPQCILTAANPGNKVELEKSDGTPVQRTYDHKDQR